MPNLSLAQSFWRLLLLLGLALPPVLQAAEWPAWRGPNYDGTAPETGLPSQWSPEGDNLLWKAPYGARSAPIVLDGQVCLNRLAEPDSPQKWQTQIACLDAETGKLRWEYRYNVYQTDIPHHRVGWASMVGDPETGYLYSHGVEGMILCFDRDGKLMWSRSMEEEVGRISGFGGRTVNPLVDGDLLIVSFLSAGWGSNFIPRHRYYALDKRTGETVWVSTPGGAPLDTTYSVPLVRVINGERLLISGDGDGSIYALRVSTGEKVWGFPLSKRGLNSSVVVEGNLVYASHSEENVDGSLAMGRLVCLDAGQITDGKPKEVWRVDGFTGGYASPAIYQGRLYHVDNSANLVAFDAKTGKQLWKYSLGIAQRASPVIADGKIFVSDVDGQFHILKLGGAEPEQLDRDEFKNADGSATQINGSPAIANGVIYLPTNDDLYAIGTKGHKAAPAAAAALPPVQAAPADAKPAHLQVVPAEISLRPGASQRFRARAFDAQGRLIGETQVQWSLKELKAAISADGDLKVADDNVPQGGLLVAKAGELEGSARVASRPTIPFRDDFEGYDEKAVPAGWPAARGRFQVIAQEGNKVLEKPSGNPRSWRTTVYFGDPAAAGYVIEADVMGAEEKRRLPDIGLVSHRYTLALMGNRQQLAIRTWLSELGRFSKAIKYTWDPNVWYHMKMQVDLAPGGDKATVHGKVWKKGEPEPAQWTVEAEDALGHRHGSPGLYGYSAASIFYDNVSVTPRVN